MLLLSCCGLTPRLVVIPLILALSADHPVLYACGTWHVARVSRWSAHVAATLARGGVSCREVDGGGLAAALVEKQLWACIFWMMSSALGGKQVG